MIAYLEGKIKYKGDKFVVLNVHGVGYKVFCCQKVISSVLEGADAQFFTHFHCREDLMDLYGFQSEDLLRLFELLISVNGVGPKAGLNIMNMLDISVLVAAIKNGDSKMLLGVPGVGRKVSEKIILELRDKIEKMNFNVQDLGGADNADLLSALVSMGYSSLSASKILADVPSDGTIGERLRAALKLLA